MQAARDASDGILNDRSAGRSTRRRELSGESQESRVHMAENSDLRAIAFKIPLQWWVLLIECLVLETALYPKILNPLRAFDTDY